MSTKVWMLVVLAVVLGGFSLYLNKDWFAKDHIQIYDRSRPVRAVFRRGAPDDSAIDPIVFGFDRPLRLSELQVIPLAGIQTNSHPQPCWHLVSDSNSVPLKSFTYGMRIRGMRPVAAGVSAQPLEPEAKYRLLIQAGTFKGEHDFVTVPRSE
jgi:hypothetical protein